MVDALAAHPTDPGSAAAAYEAASAARVEPWYHISVMTDAATLRASQPSAASSDEPPKAARFDLQTLRRLTASGDPELALLVTRMMSLLLTPAEVFGDPAVVNRLAAAATADRPTPRTSRRPSLTRSDLMAAGR